MNFHSIIRNPFLFLAIICNIMALNASEPVLMRVGHYEFTVSDFEYIYRKNNQSVKQSADECLKQYIAYKLKVVAAYEAGLDTV
jgi:hypothetical protein